jgi:cardiolipin synthase A/B
MLKKTKILFVVSILCLCFFYARLIHKTLSPNLPDPSNSIILYSNQTQQNLRTTIVRSIKNATKSIHLVMFGLSDETVLEELKNQAEKKLPMEIYYDLHSSPEIDLPKCSIHSIKNSGLMHQKILVVDNKIVFLGSANFTKTSLSMHSNLIIGIYSPEIASFLSQKTPFEVGRIIKNIRGQDIEIWLLPDRKNIALDKLINIIGSAQKKIKIAMFTLTHPRLIDEIIRAKKRGLEVTVVIDYHSGLGASAKGIEKLQKENVKVLLSRGPELLHHKYLYVDEKTLVCGSANWTKAAFSKNRDLLLILHNLKPDQKAFMNKLQKTIETMAHS